MNEALKKSVHSGLTAGVAVMTAAALTFAPSVAQPTPHSTAVSTSTVRVVSPPVQLTASTQLLSPTAVPHLLADWLERIIVPPSAGASFPTPPPPTVPTGTGIDSTVRNIYYAVEPWVRYGFEVAAYAVGWIPYVGWLAPQVMIFYNLGEPIVRSITFNVADWLAGKQSFGQGLVNVGRDSIYSLINFGWAELHFFIPNFPIPPLPPIGPFSAGATAQKVATEPVTGTDVVASKSEVDTPAPAEGTDTQTTPEPKPFHRPFRGGGLTNLIQSFTGRDVPDSTTSVSVQTLGEEKTVADTASGDQDTTGAPVRPQPRGVIGSVSSALRNLVASVPHPLHERGAAATPDKGGAGGAGDSE